MHGGAEPVEVDLLEAEGLVPGLLAVEDGLEDGGKGGDSDTSADQETNLVGEHILTGSTKWTIHGNPAREDRRNTYVYNNNNKLLLTTYSRPASLHGYGNPLCILKMFIICPN